MKCWFIFVEKYFLYKFVKNATLVHLSIYWQILYYRERETGYYWGLKQWSHRTASVEALLASCSCSCVDCASACARPSVLSVQLRLPALACLACLLDPFQHFLLLPQSASFWIAWKFGSAGFSFNLRLPHNPLVTSFLQGWILAAPVVASMLAPIQNDPMKGAKFLLSRCREKKSFFSLILGSLAGAL